jgi:hypothetical protein
MLVSRCAYVRTREIYTAQTAIDGCSPRGPTTYSTVSPDDA